MPLTPSIPGRPTSPWPHAETSQGQSQPSQVEATRLEMSEEERGRRDDVVRGLMDILSKLGQDGTYGGIPLEQTGGLGPFEPENQPDRGALKLYRLLSGHFRHHLNAVGQLANEKAAQIVPFVEEVDAGFIFIARGIRVTGPKGCKLQLYENNTVPTSFREVITNVQEFSGEPPGTCLWRGPCRILAVATECEAAGQLTVRLEGDLVPEEFNPRV